MHIVHTRVVQMALDLLLVSCLVRNVRNSCCLHALLRLLLIQVLERILVEVDRLGSESLRSDLRIILAHLVVNSFETTADFLSR